MADNQAIIDAMISAYNAEIETVMNYLANATNLDGVRAKHIKTALDTDVQEELGHAQMLAKRIKVIGGVIPGSQSLKWTQSAMQPPARSTDVESVIKGVIVAEEAAIAGYEKIIKLCEGIDYATQDLAITLMADEQEHRREFIGFLKEFQHAG